MSQLADLMKRANTSVDGVGYIGKATYKSPAMKFKTEADEGSFLQIEQVLAMEALKTEITLTEFNPQALKLANIVNGAVVPLTFRGSYDTSQGVPVAYKEEMQCQITELDLGEKGVKKAETKLNVTIHKWKLTIGGEQIYHIDQDHFLVDGVDQMAIHVANAGG